MSWNWLTGFAEFFTGKEEKPPEPLVLGAELKCPWGTSNSYLFVDSDNIDINNLPQAHVDDCIAFYNINPFGTCIYRLGQPCELCLFPADQWENSEPQNVIVNGKEIITTKSTLLCRTSGAEIKAVTTGQDAIFAKELIFYKEMIENYPGLLEILLDPYGSLYLDGEMYETALRFLDDCLARHGGELSFEFIYGGTEAEGKMIQAVLERLNPDSQKDPMANQTAYLSQLNLSITSFESVKEVARARAEEIRTNPVKRWLEENRKFTDELADGLTQAFCAILLCSAIVTTTPIEGPPNSLVPRTGTGGARLPGLVQPQLPSLGGGNIGGTGSTQTDILSDKTLTNQTGKVDNYVSSEKGTAAAKADFDAMNPTNIRTYPNGTIVGELSDGRVINLHPSTTLNGAPTLEIYDSVTGKSSKIRY